MFHLLLALLFALPSPLAQEAPAKGETPPDETYTVECTFHNPAYMGPCTVQEKVSQKLSPRDACTGILSCLNDARCLKTYCNATTVRGGWTLVKAERQKAEVPSGPMNRPAASPAPTPARS
mgnify:CR=1 FL=1